MSEDAVQPAAEEAPVPSLPGGDYAIVEILGHRTIIGRVEEVERFGSKLMAIQPVYAGALLEPVLIGGGSIYQFTPCSAETALARQPKHEWQLPVSIRAALPPAMLAAPSPDADALHAMFELGGDADEDGITF